MSYEVTATRRRPQQFDDLVGQEFVAQTLKNSIKSGKIAHAYLFTGPRGCGKTSTARILAKALNCQNGPTDCPCGECSNCREITKGTSLDVIEIDGASNTSVENVRQIKDEVLFPPSNSKYKIYIIDEVHMLSVPAFNALLKTIEEPPSYVVFIFATTELQKVPATIKSRCQQYNFRLVAIEKVKECLAQAAAELSIQADDEALFWIARESTGSMRDAYTLFDQVVAFSDGHITYDKIRDKLGLVGVERLNSLFELSCQNQIEQVLNLLDEFLQSGVSVDQIISNCADYLRSLMLIKSGVKKESLLGNSFERYSSVVLEKWNLIQIERALSIFLQLYKDVKNSLSPRFELELAFGRTCWISDYVSNSEVKKAIDAAQRLLISASETSGNGASAFASANISANSGENTSGNSRVYSFANTNNFTGTSFGNSEDKFDDKSDEQVLQNSLNKSSEENQNNFVQNQSQNQSQNQDGKMPNGLPLLRISQEKMKEMEKQNDGEEDGFGDEANSSSYSEYSDENPAFSEGGGNPFYDGGPLPPEQTAVETVQSVHPVQNGGNQNHENQVSQKNVTQLPQLKLGTVDSRAQNEQVSSINNGNTSSSMARNPVDFSKNIDMQDIKAEFGGNSLDYGNPDFNDDGDFDDGWTNVDEIPDDDYYESDEMMSQRAESFMESQNNDSEKSSAPVQTADKFTTADGAVLSVAQLRGNVMASLSVKDGFAASNLQKTGTWEVLPDCIKTTVQSLYDLELIKKKLPIISAEISAICGKEMKFLVDFKEEKKEEKKEPVQIPLQVEILVNAFKGTIIAGKI